MLKKDFFLLILIGVAFIIGCYVYPQLPEKVPSHWNLHGEVNGYASRFWGAFGLPFLLLGCYVLFQVLPLIDPRKENYIKFLRAYSLIKYAILILFFGMFIIVIVAGLGYQMRFDILFPASFNIFFMIIGNYLTTVRPNYFCGIRTPWTLANEEVWRKTHRLGGLLWVISGAIGLVALLINISFGGILSFVLIIGSVVVACIYSWWCFRNIKGKID